MIATLLLAAVLGAPTANADEGGGAGPAIPAPVVTGFVQMWVTALDQDVDPLTDPASYGDPEDDPGFKIRRARLGLDLRRQVLELLGPNDERR